MGLQNTVIFLTKRATKSSRLGRAPPSVRNQFWSVNSACTLPLKDPPQASSVGFLSRKKSNLTPLPQARDHKILWDLFLATTELINEFIFSICQLKKLKTYLYLWTITLVNSFSLSLPTSLCLNWGSFHIYVYLLLETCSEEGGSMSEVGISPATRTVLLGLQRTRTVLEVASQHITTGLKVKSFFWRSRPYEPRCRFIDHQEQYQRRSIRHWSCCRYDRFYDHSHWRNQGYDQCG